MTFPPGNSVSEDRLAATIQPCCATFASDAKPTWSGAMPCPDANKMFGYNRSTVGLKRRSPSINTNSNIPRRSCGTLSWPGIASAAAALPHGAEGLDFETLSREQLSFAAKQHSGEADGKGLPLAGDLGDMFPELFGRLRVKQSSPNAVPWKQTSG